MNESKKSELLAKRGWPIFRKVGIITGSIGALLTIGIQELCSHLVFSHESLIALLLAIPWIAVATPAAFLCQIFGWDWKVGDFYGITNTMFFIMITFNFFCCMMLGWAVVLVIALVKKSK